MDLNTVKETALKEIREAGDIKTLEELRITYLSKKGTIQSLMAKMRELSAEEKLIYKISFPASKTSRNLSSHTAGLIACD